MDVLRRINKIRIDRNWSVYRLSVESGIPQSTLTNMFNRETTPSINTLQLICNAFGMTLSEFFLEIEENDRTDMETVFLREMNKLSENDRRLVFELMRRLNEK